jgi:hypothetical protein
MQLVALLGWHTQVQASVDTSPKPGGVFKLKPGIFVAEGTRCEDTPNAAVRRYDGHGIGTAHTHACKARILSRKGSRFTVLQSCVDAGTGTGRRFSERQQIQVRDALTFTQTMRGNATTYRYCPTYQLPPGLGR